MTFCEVVRAMLRRWYVSLAVLAIAAGVTGALLNLGSLYTTKTIVSFTLSGASSLQPDNGTLDQSVIEFASAVATDVNRNQTSPRYASADAPYYGAGVRQGIAVRMPNYGGQWAPTAFTSAVIEVQIVGPDPTWVHARQTAVLQRIQSRAREQQATAPHGGRITATVEPLTTEISEVTPSKMDKLMAFAAMGLAAVVLSAWLSASLDHVASRRRRHARKARGTSRFRMTARVAS